MPFAFLFASPGVALLVGAAAAAVPVVIHLLNRKRYRVVPWAAMRFLLAARKHNSRRLRLEQWLLLTLRALLVLLLVLAMASVMPWAETVWQRVLPGEVPGASARPTTHRVLVLDASFSMGVARDGKSLFEHARSAAAELVRGSAPGDGVSVVLMGRPARTLVRGPAHDTAKVLPVLLGPDVQVSHTDADLPGALDEVSRLLDRGRGRFARREVVFLTDLQRATWSPPPAAEAKTDSPAATGSRLDDLWRKVSRARLSFIDLGRGNVDNLAVTALTLSDPLVTAGTPTGITATVRNFGSQPRKVGVELLVGRARGSAPSARGDATPTGDPAVDDPPCHPLAVDRKLIDVPAGGVPVPVPFAHAFDAPGDYLVQARTDADALDVDNQRGLVVPVKDRTLTVWLIDRNPGPGPAGKPIPSGAYDLAKVLNPRWEPEGRGKFEPDNPLRPEDLTEEQFAAGTRGDPRPDECVFVCDVPALSPRSVTRLEAHLRRGGGVVFCLGPKADRKAYNRDLYRDGDGPMPAALADWVSLSDEDAVTLDADEEEFHRPPLVEFVDNLRPGLLRLRFRQYVRLELPADSPARTVLSFKKPARPGTPPPPVKPPPAVLLARHFQGQVAVIASFGEPDGTSRVLPPRLAEFVHELLRDLVQGRPRGLTVGDAVELVLPSSHAGLDATLQKLEPLGRPKPAGTPPDPRAEVAAKDGAGVAHFPAPAQSGPYRVTVGALPREYLFAVNVPVASDDQRIESDLHRTDKPGLQRLAPQADLLVTPDPGQVLREPPHARPGEPEAAAEPPPRGPGVARLLLLLLLVLAAVETVLAWRLGSARSLAPGAEFGTAGDGPRRSSGRRRDRLGWLAVMPLAGLVLVAGVLVHEAMTGELFGFLPASWQRSVESFLGVPAPAPGEGTRWHLERLPFLADTPRGDRWPAAALAVMLAGLAIGVYARERRSLARLTAGPPRRFVGPAALRVGLFLLLVGVFLPQLSLAFQREEWPDVVLLFDDSKSMATADDSYTDPKLRAAVERLAKLCPPEELPARSRLQLAKTLVTRGENDWLTRLLATRQVKVHVYHCSQACGRLAEADDPANRDELAGHIAKLAATGPESRLGSAVRTVLEEFRGAPLAAVVMFTDGVSTEAPPEDENGDRGEDDLVAAAKVARERGVPLYFVGLGDARQPRELELSLGELPDVVMLRDRLVFHGRLTGRGDALPESVPVVLTERLPGEAKGREVARQTVRVAGGGQEIEFKLTHTPDTPGEKTYIVEVDLGPPAERARQKIATAPVERTVVVTKFEKVRVLYVEGSPRYDYRYVKTLLERETAGEGGQKAVELSVLLLDADAGYSREDRSALRDFPTREELFGYHAVILGDADPAKLGERNLSALADFVKERGGGLLFLAGEQFNPQAYRDGPLAGVLPVAFDVDRPPAEPPADPAGYRLKLTEDGKESPLFQFGPNEAASAAVREKLRPMLWSAWGYRAKRGATVLATHPGRPALAPTGGTVDPKAGFPLVLRQLVGGGRVLFFGFDETWRWRFRESEPYFNQFWLQTVRELALAPFKRPRLRTNQEKPYRVGGKVRLSAELFDKAPPPGRPVTVKVRHQPPAKPGSPPPPPSERSIGLERKGGGTYETSFPVDQPGGYEFTLESPALVPSPRATASVLPPVGETDPDRLRQNESGLRRAAAESRGKYYTLADADGLPEALPTVPRVPLEQPCSPYRLWNHPALFLLALGLVTVEWVLRKRRRLL